MLRAATAGNQFRGRMGPQRSRAIRRGHSLAEPSRPGMDWMPARAEPAHHGKASPGRDLGVDKQWTGPTG